MRKVGEIGRIHRGNLERFRYGGQTEKLQLQALVSARQTLRDQCANLLKSGCDPRLRESDNFKGKVKLSKRGVEAGRTALF